MNLYILPKPAVSRALAFEAARPGSFFIAIQFQLRQAHLKARLRGFP